MEHQIHLLEKEAYCSVLRAFKAQSDAISWDKEGLITELRKELRVPDDEHRELLLRVNNDVVIHRIREWRQTGGQQSVATLHPISISTPTPLRKKQRTSQFAPSHVVASTATPLQPSPSGPAQGYRGRRPRQSPFSNHHSTGALSGRENSMPGTGKQLIGRKVLTKWPYDNHFYEAVITQYNASDGLHALEYLDTSLEWVNLMEIPPEDIRWAEEDPGFSHRACGDKRSMGHLSGSALSQPRIQLQNGIGRMTEDIEILHTNTLIKEVERVIAASNPDCLEIEKAKNMLKEHEQALVDAISRLAYVTDGGYGNGLRLCI